ncbi:MAG: helix-turn-helix domain-containing protein [Mogibacterium kristiansenii]|uniref:helix-turn-helix domain-containing protein n=1 Tax=Mogibacterium kristiansenii TaxID=2606708 RepID=UPI003F1062F8
MTGEFGKFIEAKRKALGMTLCGLAAELNIAPAFMSDIEKGHLYPPQKEKLYEMAAILKLNEEDTNTMFDLAAGVKRERHASLCRKNQLSPCSAKCAVCQRMLF